MIDITLAKTLTGHQNPIYTLAVDTQRNTLYSAGNDKGIVEWDLDSLQFKRVLCNVPSSVYHLSVLEDRDLLIACLRSGGILVIRKEEPTLAARLTIEQGAVFVAKAIPSKNELLAVDEYGKAYVWSLESFELLYSFNVSNTTVRCAAVDEEKGIVALGDKLGEIHILDLLDYHLRISAKVHTHTVTSLAFVGEDLFSGGRDAKMYRLNVLDLSKKLEVTPHMFTVYGIVPLPYEGLFATVSRDKTLKVWDTEFQLHKNLSRDRGIDSHYLSINTACFHTAKGELFTAGDDKLIKVWYFHQP